MSNGIRKKIKYSNFVIFIAVLLNLVTANSLRAQQWNTDNYITMPYGVGTFCITVGERNALILPSFSLAPKWEFFIGASLLWEDKDREADDHFQTIIYAKRMLYESKNKTGGIAITAGTGGFPGYHQRERKIESFRNYYIYFPGTIPFFNNMISWDLNPGVIVDQQGGSDNDQWEWSFTYSTRVAIYRVIPKTAIVGEVYGTVGQIESSPEYNVGLRWEPYEQLNVSLSWGDSFDGSRGPGFQLGILLYTPPFMCKGCKKDVF
jgi:hypothetical protein